MDFTAALLTLGSIKEEITSCYQLAPTSPQESKSKQSTANRHSLPIWGILLPNLVD